MDAGGYEAWYHSPRGAWIGELELRLLRSLLRPGRGDSLLDVGCGTGYFTRRLAGESGVHVVGLDPNASWLQFAGTHGSGNERYCVGRAESLPFADRSFDLAVSVAALCFIEDPRRALREILRVTRKRFAIGLLNRHSLLYLQKGRSGGSGSYRNAHWYTARELRALFNGLPVANVALKSAIFAPNGGSIARGVECLISPSLPLGAFVVVAGDVTQGKQDHGE